MQSLNRSNVSSQQAVLSIQWFHQHFYPVVNSAACQYMLRCTARSVQLRLSYDPHGIKWFNLVIAPIAPALCVYFRLSPLCLSAMAGTPSSRHGLAGNTRPPYCGIAALHLDNKMYPFQVHKGLPCRSAEGYLGSLNLLLQHLTLFRHLSGNSFVSYLRCQLYNVTATPQVQVWPLM